MRTTLIAQQAYTAAKCPRRFQACNDKVERRASPALAAGARHEQLEFGATILYTLHAIEGRTPILPGMTQMSGQSQPRRCAAWACKCRVQANRRDAWAPAGQGVNGIAPLAADAEVHTCKDNHFRTFVLSKKRIVTSAVMRWAHQRPRSTFLVETTQCCI
jgi:hypothetical protein